MEAETRGSQGLSEQTAQLERGIEVQRWTMPPEYDVESKRGRGSTSSDFHIKAQKSLFMCMRYVNMQHIKHTEKKMALLFILEKYIVSIFVRTSHILI